jgi:hypothetical protein
MPQDHIMSPLPPRPQLVANAALLLLPPSSSTPPSTRVAQDADPQRTVTESSGSIEPHILPDAALAAQHIPDIEVTPPSLPGDAAATQGLSSPLPAARHNDKTDNDRCSSSTTPSSASRSLPSLLRYLDHDLVQNTASRNHPPHPLAPCPVCLLQWNTPVASTAHAPVRIGRHHRPHARHPHRSLFARLKRRLPPPSPSRPRTTQPTNPNATLIH